MGKRDIGRVLEGSSKSPDLRIGITSADFHTSAKVFDENDLLIRFVITEMVTGRLSFRTLAVILSCPGALFDGRLFTILSISFSVTGWKSNCLYESRPKPKPVLIWVEVGLSWIVKPNSSARVLALEAALIPTDV